MAKCPKCSSNTFEKEEDSGWWKCRNQACRYERKPNCACGHQIIWFFEYPTIKACPKCETTHYYDRESCPNCGTKLVEFTGFQRDIDEALGDDDG